MFGEVVEEFTQDIDGFATDSCSLLGTKKQVIAICRRAEAIAEQFQNTLPLFKDRAFIEHPQFWQWRLGKIPLKQVGDILVHVVKGKGEEQLFGFEIAQLKEKIQLNREVCKGCEEVFLWLGQGKHVRAIVPAQAGSAVESLDFLIVENMQSLWWWGDIRIGHTSSFT
jgi:hypothetical protein